MEKDIEEQEEAQEEHYKTTSDLNVKHFSRYGEFLVSFELSKHGWNVYSPMYDEYIDIIAHKYACAKCGKSWAMTPSLICNKCHKDFSKTEKRNIKPIKICNKCKTRTEGSSTNCKKCDNKGVDNFTLIPTCDKCGGEVKLINYYCNCGSKEYKTKFRSIQVKSSRVEYIGEKSKNTYATDHKPRDMIISKDHFFIWCLIDDDDKPHFLVMSVQDFIKTMGNSMKGTSFLKDQDRQHFSSKDYGKWKRFENNFKALE
ncbi:MAG: hypothetical protein NTX24_04835 [Candidatus Pacearchaeota archaeon]|nr:hypothetical protein [Candidatus Pacearchaeota archaeon]